MVRIEGSRLYREHALVYRPGSPVRHLYQALASLIRERMSQAFSDVVTPIYDRTG